MADESALLIQIQKLDGPWVNVGVIQSRSDRNSFSTLPDYWATPSRPVLGQIFEERGPGWAPSAQTALPKWFSHLLPEGRLRAEVARVSNTNSQREFKLLQTLGSEDLPGAIRAVTVEIDNLTELGVDAQEGRVPDEEPLLKFSLAGAQLKFSVYGSQRGLTLPARGVAGNVILKLPDGREGFSGVPQAELGCLALGKAVGIDTVDAWLTDLNEIRGLERWARRTRGQALAVTRFDRTSSNGRVHMEEFAQLLDIPVHGHQAKYRRANLETIATLVGGLCGTEAVTQVINRIVLNVLVGNGDAHLKNWAVVYPDGRNLNLSPAFDIVPTVLFMPDDDLGLKLNGSRSFATVRLSSFARLGEKASIGQGAAEDCARRAAVSILDHWPLLKDYLTTSNYATLTSRLTSIALRNELG